MSKERRQNAQLTAELVNLLGRDGFVRLAEAYGGQRLYVPLDPDGSDLARRLGAEIATKLSGRYGKSYLRVPLARELRARQYRERGMSNGDIASRLGMTETGVDKMMHRMPAKPVKGSDPRQLKMFG